MEVSAAPGPIGLEMDEMDIDIDFGPDYNDLTQAVCDHRSSAGCLRRLTWSLGIPCYYISRDC